MLYIIILMAHKLKGAVPPIVTILIILAFIVATAAVSWYITATHTRASRKPLPHLEGGVYSDGQKLYFTLRNDGTTELDVTEIEVVLPNSDPISVASTNCDKDIISPGESTKCRIDLNNIALSDGTEGIVRTPYGDLRFTVEILKP